MRQTQCTAVRTPQSAGFSLIELMIVIAVVGLLAMVALPSFMDSIRKGRRSEGIAAIAAIQQAQERWRASNPAYTTALADLSANATTAQGYYGMALSAPTAPDTLAIGYTVTATAASSQTADTKCAKLAVEILRGNLRYGSGAGLIDWTDANRCWAK